MSCSVSKIGEGCVFPGGSPAPQNSIEIVLSYLVYCSGTRTLIGASAGWSSFVLADKALSEAPRTAPRVLSSRGCRLASILMSRNYCKTILR